MKSTLAVVPFVLLLAACQSPGTAQPLAKGSCGAESRQHLVGTLAADLDQSTLPTFSRVIYPNTPVTMDYRLDRLNVHVGEDGKIDRVACG